MHCVLPATSRKIGKTAIFSAFTPPRNSITFNQVVRGSNLRWLTSQKPHYIAIYGI
nr:MAG TPA: hypothetical protein [Caudoviricetes sp.]